MLVLTRGQGERVLIFGADGEPIIAITVVEASRKTGDNCRIGFEAKPEIRVWREEVWLRLNTPDLTKPDQTG